MKISFHGAARTLTGSKHLITLDDGRKILLDCSMFQGMGPNTDNYNNDFGFDPASVNFLVLSHSPKTFPLNISQPRLLLCNTIT